MRPLLLLLLPALLVVACGDASPAGAQTVSHWLTPVDGDWSDPGKWSTDPDAPVAPGFEAVLDAAGASYTAAITGDVEVDRITINSADAAVVLDGGALTLADDISGDGGRIDANLGPFVLNEGLLRNARLYGAAGVEVRHTHSTYPAIDLEDVVLGTTLRPHPEGNNAYLRLGSTFTLDGGHLMIDRRLELLSEGSLTVAGDGLISVNAHDGFTSAEWRLLEPNAQLILDSGVTVRVTENAQLFLSEYNFPSGDGDLRNRGTIEAVGGEIVVASDVDYHSEGGLLRAVDGGVIRVEAARGDIGRVEIGEGSTVAFELGGYTLTEPINVPAGAMLDLRSSSWTSETTVTVDAGTVRVDGPDLVTGVWDWRPGSTINILGTTPYTRFGEYGIADDTRIEFTTFFPAGVISLEGAAVDIDALPGEVVLRSAKIANGTILGLPQGGVLSDPDDYLTLSATTIQTPVRVEAGRLSVLNSSIEDPVTVTGGLVELFGDWTNLGGIAIQGGRVELESVPDSVGPIALTGGTLVLPVIPATPSEIVATGGTIELENATSTMYTVADLVALPWTPETYAAGYRSTFDLEGAAFDLSAGPFSIALGGAPNRYGGIANGTIFSIAGNGPWQAAGGALRDVTLQTDIEAASEVSLDGAVTIEDARLFGPFVVSTAADSDVFFDGVTIEGVMTAGREYGSPPAIVANNLTINGELKLGTRTLQMNGGQTLSGSGVVTTDGIRGSPGGGIEVNGNLTIAEGFTFRSERNGSHLSALVTLRNQGAIIAAPDDYANGSDVPAPSITITATNGFQGAFLQEGLLQIADGYEVRVGTTNFTNSGTIELRGGVLTAASTRLESSGVIRGDGTIVALSNQFWNLGDLYVGDHGAEQQAGSPGVTGLLHVAGDYTQFDGGELYLDLGGNAAGAQYDRLTINGVVFLDGGLNVSLLDGFEPLLGNSFELVTATEGFDQQFSRVTLPVLSPGLGWSLDYGLTSLMLSVIQVPSSATTTTTAKSTRVTTPSGGPSSALLARGSPPMAMAMAGSTRWTTRSGARRWPRRRGRSVRRRRRGAAFCF